MTSKSIVLAWDQALQWEKKAKKGSTRKHIGERSEPSGGLGSGKGPFPLPRLPLGSLRSPIFFPFSPNAESWSQATIVSNKSYFATRLIYKNHQNTV